jgi:uncharacterized protein YbjT (DUF2867 family)
VEPPLIGRPTASGGSTAGGRLFVAGTPVLVECAAGPLGFELCRRLHDRGVRVRARVPEGAAREAPLRALGVDVSHSSDTDAVGLRLACHRARAVIAPAFCLDARRLRSALDARERDRHFALLETAERMGVRRYVFISVDPGLPDDIPAVRRARDIEWAVRTSGVCWTILQPGPLMEVWLGPELGWNVREGRVRIYGSGRQPLDFVSLADVAEVAVRSLDDPQAARQILRVGGPQALSPMDAVRVFEEETGTHLDVEHVPAGALRMMSRLLRPFDPVRSSLLAMEEAAARGGTAHGNSLPPTMAFPFTTVRDFAQQFVQGTLRRPLQA